MLDKERKCGILLTPNYIVNKQTTFTKQIRTYKDNINVTNNK